MTELPGPSDSVGAAPRLPAGGLSDIRRLLRRIRNVMAGARTISGQERLDRIVSLIAANMVAEVCSLYLRRAGEVLELYATEGLNKAAVHKTRLRIGEGVIGDVAARARPIALADAQAPSRIRLPAGNRRGNLSFDDGRAGAAQQPRRRRAGRAEPHPAPLYRRRGRNAPDRGHGRRRDGRVGRSGQPGRTARGRRHCAAAAAADRAEAARRAGDRGSRRASRPAGHRQCRCGGSRT